MGGDGTGAGGKSYEEKRVGGRQGKGGRREGGGLGARDPLATQATDCSSLAFLRSPVTLARPWRGTFSIIMAITC